MMVHYSNATMERFFGSGILAHHARDPFMIDFPALRLQCASDAAITVMAALDRFPLNGIAEL
jgi:hypothetical protein